MHCNGLGKPFPDRLGSGFLSRASLSLQSLALPSCGISRGQCWCPQGCCPVTVDESWCAACKAVFGILHLRAHSGSWEVPTSQGAGAGGSQGSPLRGLEGRTARHSARWHHHPAVSGCPQLKGRRQFSFANLWLLTDICIKLKIMALQLSSSSYGKIPKYGSAGRETSMQSKYALNNLIWTCF